LKAENKLSNSKHLKSKKQENKIINQKKVKKNNKMEDFSQNYLISIQIKHQK
jgi:hypothetical protein